LLGSAALLLSLACSPLATGQELQVPLIVAHRGASYDAPENTLAAFRLAWEQNADGIEGDFFLSRDGHIVCIHDDTTARTAGVNLKVADSTLAELKQLDVGAWKHKRFAGEKIPTLQEVIETVPAGKRIVIELKIGPEIVAPMKRILDASTLKPQQILVISFNQKTIAESKRVLPQIKAHWLTGYQPDDDVGPWTPSAETIVETIKQIKADGLGSHGRRTVFNDAFVETLKAGGVNEFHVWTIDEPADATFYSSLGAYGVTTNRPDLIRRELTSHSP
jgi:glycerophosphoryl diester phosphodiesterase